MRISDGSSDVCSSDLHPRRALGVGALEGDRHRVQRTLLIWIEDGAGEPVGKLLAPESLAAADLVRALRSEQRRVGKACVSTCRSRWSPDHSINNYCICHLNTNKSN